MRCRAIRFCGLAGIVLGLTLCGRANVAREAARDRPRPSFAEVQKLVLRHFAMLPDYRPGDIIAQSEVEPLFAQLKRMGWAVPERKRLLHKVPGDRDFLIRKLRTPRGRKFMRRIADYPGAYDRLDRLSWLPQGKQTVHDLIHKTGGHEMIEYLTTSAGGAALGKMLSRAPKGAHFNEPSGRIYTVEELLARLKRRYAAAAKAPAQKQSSP